MAIFKLIDKDYGTPGDGLRLIQYILNEKHNLFMADSLNLLDTDAQTVDAQFQYYKKYYRQIDGRYCYHFVLSFSLAESNRPDSIDILNICSFYIATYFPKHQILWAIHRDKPHLHTHFILNAIDHKTGKRIRFNIGTLNDLLNNIAFWLSKYNIALHSRSYKDFSGKLRKGRDPYDFSS